MPQICPACGQLQPDGPRCLNCGTKFEVPIQTTQGTWVTIRQLRDSALAILGLIALAVIAVIAIGAIIITLAD